MQNPRFLEDCIRELRAAAGAVEVIRGDRYNAVWALRLTGFPLPDLLEERSVDITIPLPRCAGFLPDASIGGIHLSTGLHAQFEGERTLVPFCDPVDLDWVGKTARFYAVHERRPELVYPSHFLCLNSDTDVATRPLEALRLAWEYLSRWHEYAALLARRHGEVLRGAGQGDAADSRMWLDHLTKYCGTRLRAALLREAGLDAPAG